MDGQIRSENATCGRRSLLNMEENNLCFRKYPATCGRGVFSRQWSVSRFLRGNQSRDLKEPATVFTESRVIPISRGEGHMTLLRVKRVFAQKINEMSFLCLSRRYQILVQQ